MTDKPTLTEAYQQGRDDERKEFIRMISGTTTMKELAAYLEVPLVQLIDTLTALKEEFDDYEEWA